MRSFYIILFLLLGSVSPALAQAFSIKGRIVDRASGESLPGASIGLSGTAMGAVSDGAGSFTIKGVAPGTYTLKTSYIGYVAIEQKITITNHDETVSIRLAEDNATLNEVQVVAEVAVERETPVAFSTVNEVKLRESLAGRDLPMILNETPGVYASQGRGGSGDAEISIRGFDQRNVAVLINGVPVNDMENGQVYWSNWDLGDVTKSLQVQRGLTASKLAVPSVGGTINVLTKGFEAKRGGRAKQEVGYNGYRKTSLMLSSGQLKGDWAVTVFGSRRTGNGWINGLYDDAWTYFGTVSKRLGKHQLSLTGLGSPQKHGQLNPFGYNISTYSATKAVELGDQSNKVERGYRFNQDWNTINRYKLNPDGTRGADNIQELTTQANYYHKPQINLNHFWNATDKLLISNVVYGSHGTGGSVVPSFQSSKYDSTGRIDLQRIYDTNISKRNQPMVTYRRRLPNGSLTDSVITDGEAFSNGSNGGFLYSSVNNHKWYGFITSADYRLNEQTTLSAGVDGRYYRGEHYRKVYDLLGGDYVYDTFVPSGIGPNGSGLQTTPTNLSSTSTGDQYSNPYRKLRVGDKMYGNYDGITKWLGGYSQVEYKKGPLAGFMSGTFSMTTYQRIDYFGAVPITLANGKKVFIGNNLTRINGESDNNTTLYYTNSPTVVVRKASNDFNGQWSRADTTLMMGQGDSVSYNGKTYRRVDVSGSTPRKSAVVKLPGFTVKAGFNYNLTEDNNIFFNIGFLSRAQYFTYIFAGQERIPDTKNEQVFSTEVGYAISKPGFKAALNAYRTSWVNRSLTATVPDPRNDQQVKVNVTGLSSVHMGAELDIAQELSRQLQLNAAFSVGDWRYGSIGTARIVDDAGQVVVENKINAKGVHVGGAAQNQFMLGLRYEPIRGLYVRPTYTLFAKYYSTFNASQASPDNPVDSYRLPTMRTVDVHMGYSYAVTVGGRSYRASLYGSVLNVFNEFFIANVPNFSSSSNSFDPSQVLVYFNQGRRATMGLSIDF